MASTRQVRAAKQNLQKAQQAARQKRTIANLPESTRRELGKQAAKGRQRGGRAGHALETGTASNSKRSPRSRTSATARRWASGI